MKTLVLAFLILGLVVASNAITVNPLSNVSGDSANTATTLVYRDTSGNFAAGTITASALTLTGAVNQTASTISVSSSSTSAFNLTIDGAYTSAQISAKTPSAVGQLIYNSTLPNLCISTGTTIQGYKLAGTASTVCQ